MMNKLVSICLLLISITVSSSLYAQDDYPIERKIRRVLNSERRINHLPLEAEYINNTIIPEVKVKKSELAPHFPEISRPYNEAALKLLESWVIEYPTEYDTYVNYLQDYTRSFK